MVTRKIGFVFAFCYFCLISGCLESPSNSRDPRASLRVDNIRYVYVKSRGRSIILQKGISHLLVESIIESANTPWSANGDLSEIYIYVEDPSNTYFYFHAVIDNDDLCLSYFAKGKETPMQLVGNAPPALKALLKLEAGGI